MDNKNIKGIVFSDLDGTLLYNRENLIPESALTARRKLKENGYIFVISTGRDMDTHYSVDYRDKVRADAIIHLNGNKITVGGTEIFHHYMDMDFLRELYGFCAENGICIGTSIGNYDYYLNAEKKRRADAAFNLYVRRNFRPFEEIFEKGLKVTALSYAGEYKKDEAVLRERFPSIILLPFNSDVGADMVEEGFSKAEGMKRLCEFYGVDRSSTWAFGDSPNDLALIKAAGCGIAMGNADRPVREAADYITDDITEDGIYNACRHFGLI